MAIDIDVVPRKPIDLNFRAKDGTIDTYQMEPPKGSIAMTLAERAQDAVATGEVKTMWGEIEGWFIDGLGKKQWKRLNARLMDPADPLDIVHLVKAMEGVVEEVASNPSS